MRPKQRENPNGQPRVLKTCPGCGEEKMIWRDSTYCSIRCGKVGRKRPDMSGAKNWAWKGDETSYRGMHQRVEGTRGKAKGHDCACGAQAEDWANLTGDYNDIWDYEAMCRFCHRAYDKTRKQAS